MKVIAQSHLESGISPGGQFRLVEDCAGKGCDGQPQEGVGNNESLHFGGFADKLQVVYEKAECPMRCLDVFVSIDIEHGISNTACSYLYLHMREHCILYSW